MRSDVLEVVPFDAVLSQVVRIAEQAGEIIVRIYNQGRDNFFVDTKPDGSPRTEADMASQDFIMYHLPDVHLEDDNSCIPIISEEARLADIEERCQWTRYWLVDPLDGTKEFLDRTEEFTVNIALIENGRPIMGVIYVPMTKVCYFAEAGRGAFKQVLSHAEITSIQTRQHTEEDDIIVVTSHHHTSHHIMDLANALPHAHIQQHGSALKLGLLAEGKADIYTRFNNMLEWDLAAGHCIIEQAGGRVTSITGEPLTYNAAQLKHPNFFAIGCRDYPWQSYITTVTN